jgi:ATP-dependent helicase YprA (DUF1998 family)
MSVQASTFRLTSIIHLSLTQAIEEITEDGAPSGRKDFLVWNPPYVEASARQLGRQSSLAEATGLMRFLMKRGVRVILFCKVGLIVSHQHWLSLKSHFLGL